jgi:hypothetical protein
MEVTVSGTDEHTVWEVVAITTQSPGQPANAAQEEVIAQGPEDEVRRVYTDTVAVAADKGYQAVKLRTDGRDVESWPQATGWTS